jgi:hypothetical protein
VFVFDPAAKATFILSIIRSLLARLHAAGGIPPGGLPMAMVGAGSAVHATGAAAAETVGTDVPVRITSVPVTLPWPQIVDRLNALQPPALIGFASALARLGGRAERGSPAHRPNGDHLNQRDPAARGTRGDHGGLWHPGHRTASPPPRG